MQATAGHLFARLRMCRGAAHEHRAGGRSMVKVAAATQAILISVVLATAVTTASAAEECITSLPAKRDVHWYYYVRKSDGAHCWYPGSQEARAAAARDAATHEAKPKAQSSLATKPEATTKVTKPEAVTKTTKPEAVTKTTKPEAATKATKPVAAIERPPARKSAKAEAEARLNAMAAELEPDAPATPAEAIGTRWPGTNLSLERSTARREAPQQRRD
jgi:hypothetical protein